MRQIILGEEQIKKLENILGEIPMKWAKPIISTLEEGVQPEPEGAVLPKPRESEKV